MNNLVNNINKNAKLLLVVVLLIMVSVQHYKGIFESKCRYCSRGLRG